MFAPHITAIMVTGKTVDRYPMALRSVESFKRQLYPNRSLLIVNDHPETPLLPNNEDCHITEVMCHIQNKPRRSLGELRTLGIQLAGNLHQGDEHYLMQWDDDDFSHWERMRYQVDRTQRGSASIFKWELHAHLQNRTVFANNGSVARANGFAGTMLWPAAAKVRFPDLGKHEDTEFVLALKQVCGVRVIDNDPMMYLRFYHGHNTWGEKHVMQRKPGSRNCTPEEQSYFDDIYEQHYEVLRNADAG